MVTNIEDIIAIADAKARYRHVGIFAEKDSQAATDFKPQKVKMSTPTDIKCSCGGTCNLTTHGDGLVEEFRFEVWCSVCGGGALGGFHTKNEAIEEAQKYFASQEKYQQPLESASKAELLELIAWYQSAFDRRLTYHLKSQLWVLRTRKLSDKMTMLSERLEKLSGDKWLEAHSRFTTIQQQLDKLLGI